MEFEDVIQEIREIKARYTSIEKIVLFGSRARGDYSKTSDIDLCIFGNDEAKRRFHHIAYEIDDIYTFYQFDILFFDTISNQELKLKILEEGIEV
jgi:predicted nucleotidyltransferase